jgi:hypothetical protein
MNRSLFLLVAAVVCFVVALMLELGVVNGSDWHAWTLGGLVAFAAAHLP